MNRLDIPGQAAIVVPLALAAFIMTAPQTAQPLLMALIPLGWATFVIIVIDSRDIMAAYSSALPFSAYAVVAFTAAPYMPTLVAAWTSAAASGAVARLASGTRPREAGTGRLWRSATLLAGWVPGCAATLTAGPWSGAAVSVLTALVALYIKARRIR
jgi:hypothetical protein